MKIARKAWVGTALLALFGMWWGVPTYNKWRADNLVNELCAKDGGVKVYQTVEMAKERFNQMGQFEVRNERFMRSNDEYYTTWKIKDIIGEHSSSDTSRLSVHQHHFQMYRAVDKRLLGEAISYSRRGGDPVGPWMPSAYTCPADIDNKLSKQVFVTAK